MQHPEDEKPAHNDPAKEENPWLAGAGMFADDPLFEDWQRAIRENRRELDRDVGEPED